MRTRRAVALLWFVMIFLITASFVGAIAIDYGQVLFARSQVRSVAADAALQAAKRYQVSDALPIGALLLDEDAARAAVNEVLDTAAAQGAVRKAKITKVSVRFENNGVENASWAVISSENPDIKPVVPRVVVSVTYEVTDLALMDTFAAVSNGVKTVITTTIAQSAVICVPGMNPDTLHGACARSAS